VALAIIIASAFEILPTFLIGDNVPRIASVKPYTPLELYGRDIYVREGCYNCHSQMVRPFVDETVRYGEYSKPGEFIYDRPFQWGSRRIGPDLHREGGLRSNLWHYRHFQKPTTTSPGSVMPNYPHLLEDAMDFATIQKRVGTMAMLGVPYDASALNQGGELARKQAEQIAAALVSEGGPTVSPDREVLALIAYMQRLGTDIKNKAATTTEKQAEAPAPAPASAAQGGN
jgi:cytochrome c oxidase cbb3-type subunit I/II